MCRLSVYVGWNLEAHMSCGRDHEKLGACQHSAPVDRRTVDEKNRAREIDTSGERNFDIAAIHRDLSVKQTDFYELSIALLYCHRRFEATCLPGRPGGATEQNPAGRFKGLERTCLFWFCKSVMPDARALFSRTFRWRNAHWVCDNTWLVL